jgi:hypothetical protein
LAVLSFFHDYPKKSFPKEFLSQTTISTCIRATLLGATDRLRPAPVEMTTYSMDPNVIKSVAFVLRYIQQAQEKLVSTSAEDDNIWPCLPSFGATFNQLASSYKKELTYNLSLHASTRLMTVIKAEVGPRMEQDKNLSRDIFRQIVRSKYTNKEDIRVHASSFLKTTFVQELIKEHHEWLKDAFDELENVDLEDGIISTSNVQQNSHLFLGYQLFLSQRLSTLGVSEEQRDEKGKNTPFDIIPQLTMKRRSVTFTKEPTTELLCYLIRENQADDFIKKADLAINNDTNPKRKHMDKKKTDDQNNRKKKKKKKLDHPVKLTRQKLITLWSKDLGLFSCPKNIRNQWNGVVTTDGVTASWHLLSRHVWKLPLFKGL